MGWKQDPGRRLRLRCGLLLLHGARAWSRLPGHGLSMVFERVSAPYSPFPAPLAPPWQGGVGGSVNDRRVRPLPDPGRFPGRQRRAHPAGLPRLVARVPPRQEFGRGEGGSLCQQNHIGERENGGKGGGCPGGRPREACRTIRPRQAEAARLPAMLVVWVLGHGRGMPAPTPLSGQRARRRTKR